MADKNESPRPRLLLRTEPFGGILADRYSSRVRFFGRTGFFLIEEILSGQPDEQIVSAVRQKFSGAENQDVATHIQLCRQHLEQFVTGDERHTIETDLDESVPILKGPLDLTLEITKRCNLTCRHCYNRSSAQSADELSWEYIRTVLEQVAADRIRFLSIIGGEPLMHPNLMSILRMGREIAESVNLSSNGTIWGKHPIDEAAACIDTANISLDAPSAELHDSFRGRAGSFEKAVDAIRRLAKNRVEVTVQTTVFRGNIRVLNALGRLVEQLGAATWSVRVPLDSGRVKDNSELFLSHDELVECEHLLTGLHHMGLGIHVFAGLPVPWSRAEPYQKTEQPNPLIACAAGTVMAVVLADRRLTPCVLFSGTDYAEPMPDPTKFKQLWRESDFFSRIRRMHLQQVPMCRRCSHYGAKCATECRGKAYLSHGDIATPDPDCRYWRKRVQFA
jgi:MoaA/NifB/PqqE/SkfB family radical SAM enzyme